MLVMLERFNKVVIPLSDGDELDLEGGGAIVNYVPQERADKARAQYPDLLKDLVLWEVDADRIVTLSLDLELIKSKYKWLYNQLFNLDGPTRPS